MKTMDQLAIVAELRIDYAGVTAGWSGHDATGRYVVTASAMQVIAESDYFIGARGQFDLKTKAANHSGWRVVA